MSREPQGRMPIIAIISSVTLFSVGLALYAWCTLTHWCMAGHLAHNQSYGMETDIIWGCSFIACGLLGWFAHFKYVRLLWLLLSLLIVFQFLWVNTALLALLVITICALFVVEIKVARKSKRTNLARHSFGELFLALVLFLNITSIGTILIKVTYAGKKRMEPNNQQQALIDRIEGLGGAALSWNLHAQSFRIYGAAFQDIPLKDSDLEILRDFSEINELNLSGTQVSDIGMTNLLHLRHLNNVSLARTRITDNGTHFLKNMTGYHLKIDLSQTEIGDKTVENLPTRDVIFNLDLSNTKITDNALAVLAKRTREIVDLSLKNTIISDEGIRHLSSANITESLDLRNTAITDSSIDILVTMGTKEANIRVFELGGSGVTTNGAKRLYDECYGHGVEVYSETRSRNLRRSGKLIRSTQ